MPDDKTLEAYEAGAVELTSDHDGQRSAYAERFARHVPPVGRVLDVGAGGAHVLATLLKRGQEAIGIEPSAAMWREAAPAPAPG